MPRLTTKDILNVSFDDVIPDYKSDYYPDARSLALYKIGAAPLYADDLTLQEIRDAERLLRFVRGAMVGRGNDIKSFYRHVYGDLGRGVPLYHAIYYNAKDFIKSSVLDEFIDNPEVAVKKLEQTNPLFKAVMDERRRLAAEEEEKRKFLERQAFKEKLDAYNKSLWGNIVDSAGITYPPETLELPAATLKANPDKNYLDLLGK